MGLKTYKTVPVSAPIWLENALGAVIKACQFEAPPPVDLCQTGVWRGWCQTLNEVPDGRVAMSSRAQFWRKAEVAQVYLHEAGHRLIPNSLHGPAFFCMNLCLLMRADSTQLDEGAGASASFSSSPSLYDISDLPDELASEPDQGLSRSIQWSVLTARELVQSHPQMSAEGLASEVIRRFDKWLIEVATEPKKRAQHLQNVARQREVLASLKEQIWTMKLVIFGLGLLVTALFFLGSK